MSITVWDHDLISCLFLLQMRDRFLTFTVALSRFMSWRRTVCLLHRSHCNTDIDILLRGLGHSRTECYSSMAMQTSALFWTVNAVPTKHASPNIIKLHSIQSIQFVIQLTSCQLTIYHNFFILLSLFLFLWPSHYVQAASFFCRHTDTSYPPC